MGKKAKNKAKTSHKLPVPSSPRSHPHPKGSDPSLEAADACEHYDKDNPSANGILLKLHSASSDAVCEDCRDEPRAKVDGKGKGKGGKKKAGPAQSKSASAPVTIWVCLDCGHFGCAGDADISKPYGHARRHHKHSKHLLAVQLDNPRACWCFECDSPLGIGLPEGAAVECNPAKSVDSVDSMDQGMEIGTPGENSIADMGRTYAVRGIVNLGNTCFFNSIMQNLFAMDMMRDYFSSLSVGSGSLTMSLKKLYGETRSGAELSKGIVNPKNLFGCICSKAPQFRGFQQQDSHELLRYLLDGLSTEELNLRKPPSSSCEDKTSTQLPPSFVDSLFGGQISSSVCCVECGHTSVVYEPFLDLSLPVPAKQVVPKKATSTQPKKGNLPPSSRGRKARERASMKLHGPGQLKSGVNGSLDSGEQNLLEPVDSTFESSSSYNTPEAEQGENTSFAGGDMTWMDFIGPVTQTSDDFAIRDVEDMGIVQRKDDVPQTAKESLVLVETSGEEANAPMKNLDAEIMLLPYKDATSTFDQVNEKIGDSWMPENAGSGGSVVNLTDITPTSSSVCGSAEVEFDGLGDLFAEPEVTSAANTETTVGEGPEMSWLSGTGSETAQEEVDNTNAPVSIDSCLAYFTKPELLSGEHAWHCENCLQILQHQSQKSHTKTITSEPEGSLALSRKGKGNGNSRGNTLTSVDPFHEVLENGKLACSLGSKISGSESYKNISDTEAILNNTSVPTEYMNGNCSSLPDLDICHENCSKVPLGDREVADSGTSKYFPYTSSVGKVNCLVSSCDLDSGSCSNSKLNDDLCDAQSLDESYKVSRSCTEEDSSNSCGNNGANNSRKAKRRGAKLLSKVHNNEEIESENVKVKRDATKRILVYKTPSILTIHLKRFSQDARGRLNKLSGHVSFKELLDLSSYMDPSCRETESYWYRLVGVVEHSGNMRGGHYIAYVRGQRGKGLVDGDGLSRTWFYTSDAHVREASLSEVLQSEAYILFYERVRP